MVDIVDLRNLVAEAEGTTDAKASQENFASGYDVPFAYGQYLQPSKPISQMTFQELRDFQGRQVNATKGTFDNTNLGTGAVGRYQFIGRTLENLKNRLGYKDTDVFSPEVQDRLFDALMEEQGLQKLLAGLITPEKFQEKLSSQFASIPKPGTETGTYKGQNTGVTSDRVSAVLSSMQADTQTDQMLSEEQPGSTFRSEDDTVPSDTGTVTSDQVEEEPGFLDTVGEYVGDAYDTASEYVSETVDTLERVAESVGEKLRRLLGSEEEQSNTSVDNPPIPEPRPERRPVAVDNPPIPEPRPERRPVAVDNPPIPEPRPKQAVVDFSDVVDFVGTLKKAEGGSVEKKAEFIKKDDDDDVPDPPPGATPEEVADDIPAYLSTGEYVLPANVVRYIGLKNITGMHQRALSELQQMEDLDIIENVDENGYVEEDDDEMDYMEPEEAGVVEIVVAEHHPKGLMAMGFAEGGMINSDSSMEEGQVLPTSDIFSEGVYAQANINRSVDSEDVVESDKVITAPVAFSSAPGKTAYLAYITPEEAASLRQAKQGFSSEGNGQEVSDGQYQHLGPKGLMSFNGTAGTGVGGTAGGYGAGDVGSGSGKGASSSSGAGDEDDATDPGAAKAEQDESPIGGVVGAINEFMGFDPTHGYAGKGVTDPTTGEVYGPGGLASVSRSYTEKDVRDPKSVASAVGMGLGSIAGGLAGIGQAAVNAAVAAGVDVQEASTNDIGGGSQEFPEEKKADTDSTKTTDTDPLSDYIYVPGVGYRRRVKRVKPLSKLKAGGYVSKKGIMARGYSEGGMINSDSSFEEGQVLPTSDIFSEGVYAQVNIDRSVDSENVVESDKVITAPIAFSSAPGKTAYLAYITPEEAASLRQAKQGFSSEGNGLEVSDGQYQHLGPKGLMSFNGDDGGGVGGTAGGYGAGDVGAAASDPGPGDGHGGGASEFVEDLEPEDVEEEKPTDPYEGYAYVKGIGYVPTSRRATSNKPIESASLALSSIFTPGFLSTIGLMGDPNKEL
jgi:hypothetical protein